MNAPVYHVPEHAHIAWDAIGSIVVSTIIETRGASIMHYETAVSAGAAAYVVVGMYWEEQREEALAAHALLVEQISAMM